MENLHNWLYQAARFASNVAWSERGNQQNHKLIVRMIRFRIVQEGKKCASKHHFDVFSWVTTSFYFFEACDSVHGMGIVAESYPALKRLYSLLKSNRRNSVYAIFAKTFAYHAIINFFHIFCKGFLKNFLTFLECPHPPSVFFPLPNVNKFNAFYRRKFGIKIFLKNFLKITCKRFRLVIYLSRFRKTFV